MRILIAETSQYIAFHGQAIFTINLAEGLVKRGHTVLALVGSELGHAYRAKRNGVQVQAVKSISLKAFHPDSSLPFPPGKVVRRIFDEFQPEIVHIQDHYPLSRRVVLTARQRGVKCVGTNHFMPENLAPYVLLLSKIKPVFNWALWHWMRATYDRLDVVIAPSRTAANLVRAEGLKPQVLPISCGVDTGLFQPNPSVDRAYWRAHYGIDLQRKVFFFVGRVDKEKRLDVLLHAIHSLQRDDIQLVIGGKGAALGEMEALARRLNLGQKVHFTGFIPNEDLPGVLNSIDVFVMPSEAELLSISSLEAMACARPLLVARAVALPELVDEGVNGLMFNPGEAEDAAHCLTWCANHPERWPEMGSASLAKVQAHSLENIVSRYEKLYEMILAGALLEELH